MTVENIGAKKVIIDTDPGIDDSAAILLALAPSKDQSSANLDVKAITTVSGNLVASRCTLNAQKVLSMINRKDIPLGQGPEKPLVRDYPRDPFFHGTDGLGDLNLSELESQTKGFPQSKNASDLIIDTVNKYPQEITFIALGPLTNLALALIKDPELPQKLKEVVIIGGSYGFNAVEGLYATGDNPVSEWNIYVDPEAADLVFNGKFNLVAIGLDIFTQPSIALGDDSYRKLKEKGTAPSKYITGVLDFGRKRGFNDYCALIDSLAVAYAIDHTLMKTESVQVAVETKSDIALGQTIVDRRKNFRWEHLPSINAACSIEGERYVELLVSSYLRY